MLNVNPSPMRSLATGMIDHPWGKRSVGFASWIPIPPRLVGYDSNAMPSWNIHTAHVERLLSDHRAEDLGIEDRNAFLFGNYVPDIYVGFMVPKASFHIDYCITHFAAINIIPIPDADLFWDYYIARRWPTSPVGLSLALGAWAHLVADRFYNGWFRTFSIEHDVPKGEELRVMKQGDFHLFGNSLNISSYVSVTPELLDAAWSFHPYRILADDVERAVEVANAIVQKSATPTTDQGEYALLSAEWMMSVLEACDERLITWLSAWQSLVADGRCYRAADVRAEAGLPSAEFDDPNWLTRGKSPSA